MVVEKHNKKKPNFAKKKKSLCKDYSLCLCVQIKFGFQLGFGRLPFNL